MNWCKDGEAKNPARCACGWQTDGDRLARSALPVFPCVRWHGRTASVEDRNKEAMIATTCRLPQYIGPDGSCTALYTKRTCSV